MSIYKLHVVPTGKKWVVKDVATGRRKIYLTKSQAIDAARASAGDAVLVYGKSGQPIWKSDTLSRLSETKIRAAVRAIALKRTKGIEKTSRAQHLKTASISNRD